MKPIVTRDVSKIDRFPSAGRCRLGDTLRASVTSTEAASFAKLRDAAFRNLTGDPLQLFQRIVPLG